MQVYKLTIGCNQQNCTNTMTDLRSYPPVYTNYKPAYCALGVCGITKNDTSVFVKPVPQHY